MEKLKISGSVYSQAKTSLNVIIMPGSGFFTAIAITLKIMFVDNSKALIVLPRNGNSKGVVFRNPNSFPKRRLYNTFTVLLAKKTTLTYNIQVLN